MEDCIKIIRTVTDSDDYFFMQTHSQRLKKTINCDFDAFRQKKHNIDELSLYEKIIKEIDFIDQDPYRTNDEFEKMKENGHVLIGYDALNLAWKQCYFDVTFMLAELPVLPKPAALELCIDNSQKLVSFHPFLYGLLLEFLWHEKYGSGNEGKKSVLEKMEKCVLKFQMNKSLEDLIL
ncbi:unnamed protein product [Mytilus coruscus]|uniref:Uncharacterized protein n=1 Tax=Mytilus coruscus TaxID=42192 RepID=A0A6J8EQ50_MYTCO|nr:unnamed protein product [Mytilus coruscus]